MPFAIATETDPRSEIRLPPSPAVAAGGGRLVVRDGHFFVGERRVRMWGVNLCFGANFPARPDAGRVAARLAAAGVNAVRFHHMDSSPFPRGIWDRRDPWKLSAEALDRLDYFIDQLARRGIYANLNLHVSRTHSRALRLPDADKLPHYDKIVDLFTPALIEAQKRYARDLLTHVNKYRNVRYADDPAVAFVEITNEDSFFMWGAERTLTTLPRHYARALQVKYASWLKRRYRTVAALRAAWSQGADPLGDDLLADGAFRRLGQAGGEKHAWRLEQHGGAAARAVRTDQGARIEIVKDDGIGWHVQFNQGGVPLKGQRYYTLTFRARSDGARRIGYNVGQAHEPWRMLGLNAGAGLTRQWRDYRAGFIASADDDDARVNFVLGGSRLGVELADVRLRPGGREGLREGESLDPGGVDLFAKSETEPRFMDRWRFLVETEKAYFDGMYAFIKKDLGCKALVTGTIVFGPCGLYAQSGMDYVDGHAYWQHPRFPGRAWDPANWLVEQKAMVDRPAESPLFRLAAQRLAGKPYTVSEYNHPAPNDYQAECVPTLAAFAAAQDWDGIWLFAYSHRADDWDRRHFSSFFDIDANPAKWGFVPAGAAMFRDVAVGPLSPAGAVRLANSSDPLGDLIRRHVMTGRDMLESLARDPGIDRRRALESRVCVSLGAKADPPPGAGRSGTVLTWRGKGIGAASDETSPPAFIVSARGARAWVCRSGPGGSPGLGLALEAPRFAATTVTALDGKSLTQSRRILIAACGRCENAGMKFSNDRRTVGRNWGGPPARIEPVTASLRLPWLSAGEWRCQVLGPDGRARSEVPMRKEPDGVRAVRLSAAHRTMWYLLARQ